MTYSVKELRENLATKIIGLKIDPKFKENPGFDAAIELIDRQISQMNMFESAENILVQEAEGEISFTWISNLDGTKYTFSILRKDSKTICSVVTSERNEGYSTELGRELKSKTAKEIEVSLDVFGLNIRENGSIITNTQQDLNKCHNTSWAEQRKYNNKGVMSMREYKGFAPAELSKSIEHARVDEMLLVSRNAYVFGFWNDKYVDRTLLVREKLDCARVVKEDKAQGIKYCAVSMLNDEYGLRDMYLPGGSNPYPRDVIIEPMSSEDIDKLLQKERDPRVASGLKDYAIGRNTYHYNAYEDPHFVYTQVTCLKK